MHFFKPCAIIVDILVKESVSLCSAFGLSWVCVLCVSVWFLGLEQNHCSLYMSTWLWGELTLTCCKRWLLRPTPNQQLTFIPTSLNNACESHHNKLYLVFVEKGSTSRKCEQQVEKGNPVITGNATYNATNENIHFDKKIIIRQRFVFSSPVPICHLMNFVKWMFVDQKSSLYTKLYLS